MEEIARVDGRMGSVEANCGQNLFIPEAGDALGRRGGLHQAKGSGQGKDQAAGPVSHWACTRSQNFSSRLKNIFSTPSTRLRPVEPTPKDHSSWKRASCE